MRRASILLMLLLCLAAATRQSSATGESNDEPTLLAGWAAMKAGDLKKAEKIWLSIYQDPTFGQFHHVGYEQLVEVYSREGEDAKALKLIAKEMSHLNDYYGANDLHLAQKYHQSATGAQKNSPALAKYLRQMRDQVIEADKKQTAGELALMGEREKALTLLQTGNSAEAAIVLKAEIQRARRQLPDSSPELPMALIDLSRTQQELKHFADAGLLLAEAISILAKHNDGQYPYFRFRVTESGESSSGGNRQVFKIDNLYPICKKLLTDTGQLDKLPQIDPALLASRAATKTVSAALRQDSFERTYNDLNAFTKIELAAISVFRTQATNTSFGFTTTPHNPSLTTGFMDFQHREDPRLTKARSMMGLGPNGNLPEAENILKNFLATSSGSILEREQARQMLGHVLTRQGKVDQSLELQKTRLKELTAQYGEDSHSLAQVYEDMARIFEHCPTPDKDKAAQYRSERDKILATRQDRRKAQWTCMQKRVSALQAARNKNLDQALVILTKELAEAQALHQPNGEVPAVMTDIARVKQEQGKFSEAVDWYNKAMEYLLKSPNVYHDTEVKFSGASISTIGSTATYGKSPMQVSMTCRQLIKKLSPKEGAPDKSGAGLQHRYDGTTRMEIEMNDFDEYITSELEGIKAWGVRFRLVPAL